MVSGSDAKQYVVFHREAMPSSFVLDRDLSIHASRRSKNAENFFDSSFGVACSKIFDKFRSSCQQPDRIHEQRCRCLMTGEQDECASTNQFEVGELVTCSVDEQGHQGVRWFDSFSVDQMLKEVAEFASRCNSLLRGGGVWISGKNYGR